MTELIVHLARSDEWAEARSSGVYAPSGLADDGFIHLSRREQAHLPANALFANRDDLVLLWVDAELLTGPLRYEASEPDDEMFPHLYAPLNVSSVVAVQDLPAWDPGGFVLPPPP